jgi:hypothetical protein
MTGTDRDAAIRAFLAQAGWAGADRRTLAADASFRRYDRLERAGARAVLMDAPPPHEDVRPFAQVAGLLRDLGFSAPEIFAADPERGLLLLEDLGDRTFAKALAEGADPEPLYRLATDTMIALQRAWAARGPADPGLPAYDARLLVDREAMLLTAWALPALGAAPDADARAAYAAAWRDALQPVLAGPRTLVLRDYFPDNLMWLARPGTGACGLLDFQDAVLGSPLYDLVSLLQDARRDVPAGIEAAMWRRWRDAAPGIDPALTPEAAADAYWLLAAQRHAKVIGIFTRLAHRDGKPGYLQHVPRLWRLLEAALAQPALAPVRAWFDDHVPPAARVTPPAAPPARTETAR